MYALSRHTCCSLFLFLSLDICTDGRRRRFFSIDDLVINYFCYQINIMVLAGDITADNGMPSLSVKICFFCAKFAHINRTISNHRPSKGDSMDIESIDYQVQLIPIDLS